jgi:nitric oxide reductase subunit B
MTEWIILINIIYTWSKKLTFEIKTENLLTYKFIKSNQMWIFLNLFQSLLMSIPVLNYFTHGTHVTVAHSMGTTIGINTTILFTSIVFIISRLNPNNNLVKNKSFNFGYYLYNISLFVFWMTLMFIGVLKTLWTSEAKIFSTIHQDLAPYYMLMIFSGFCLFISLIILIFPMLRRLLPFAFNNEK